MGRPKDWWPVSDTDPVPGDPQTLAALGNQTANIAYEIEQMAKLLPTLATGDIWDSEAGDAFRQKAQSVATMLGKAKSRFQVVATALGKTTYGGYAYAATLQSCQDTADTAITAVVGPDGSEAARLRTWNQLQDAITAQLNAKIKASNSKLPAGAPAQPLVPTLGSGSDPVMMPSVGVTYPQASPGYVPPDIPTEAGDNAQVTALKSAYNQTLDTLRSTARTVSQATSDQSTAAQRAATMIRGVIDNDGLENPTGLDALWHAVTTLYDDHVVGVLKTIAQIAGDLATVCGIIAMVLAFIPGMEEFAAAFETLSLLFTAVAFVCHLVLFATGKGGLLDVVLDLVALVTMGVGKGLIGGAEATADLSENMAEAFNSGAEAAGGESEAVDDGVAYLGGSERSGNLLNEDEGPSFLSAAWKTAQETFNPKSAFTELTKGENWSNLGDAFKNGQLVTALKSSVTLRSPEIEESLSRSIGAAVETPHYAATIDLADNVVFAQREFQAVQAVGLGVDLFDKADQITNVAGGHIPGWDNIKDWPVPAGDGG